MDVFSQVLGALKLRSTLYFTTEFSPPWGVRVPPFGRVARFHLVLRGECWFGDEHDDGRVRLGRGDLVIVPHGAGHVLADGPATPAVELPRVLEQSRFTGRGALVFGGEDRGSPTRLLCGHFEFDESSGRAFLQRLPKRLLLRAEDMEGSPRLEDTVRAIEREVRDGRPGCDAVTRRQSEILFIQLVRTWAEQAAPDPGLLTALDDPHLGRCLEAIHDRPGAGWTLASLAREARLSRSVFAARFQRLLGQSAMQYVTLWRMHEARRRLEESRDPLDAIADRVGYRSTAAFSRVFKKVMGESPGRYRRGAGTGGD